MRWSASILQSCLTAASDASPAEALPEVAHGDVKLEIGDITIVGDMGRRRGCR